MVKRAFVIGVLSLVLQGMVYAGGITGADIVILMDDSGSMSGAQTFMATQVTSMQAGLVGAGIPNNQWGLVRYGGSDSLVVGENTLWGAPVTMLTGGLAADYATASENLRLDGGTEDGYWGIDHILNTYAFRSGVGAAIILITDESRVSNGNVERTDLTYENILAALQARNVTLVSIIAATITAGGTGANGLTVDTSGKVTFADGSTGTNGQVSGEYSSIATDYATLALASDGAVANLGAINTNDQATKDAFTAAFISLLTDVISTGGIIVIGNEVFIVQAKAAGERLTSQSAQRLVKRIFPRFRHQGHMIPRILRQPKTAGELFDDISATGMISRTEFDDRDAGEGDDIEYLGSINGYITEKLSLGIDVSHARFRLNDELNYNSDTSGIDMTLRYEITDHISIGGFCSYADFDGDRTIRNPLTLASLPVDSDFQRWGAGLALSGAISTKHVEIGLTGLVASSNKESIDNLFDDDDTALAVMLDVSRDFNDHITGTLYGQHFHYLESDFDGNFWVAGAAISFAPNDRWYLAVGYEQTLEQQGYDSSTVSVSATYNF